MTELAQLRSRIAELEVSESKQQQTAEALRGSETQYRRLFETARDGILILDAETGDISAVNPFLTNLLGYSEQEILGKKLWEIGPFKDKKVSKIAFQELQTQEYIRYEDLPLETKDGKSIAVEFISNVYRADRKKVIQCNIRDITERKRAEEGAEEAKARLVAILEATPDLVSIADLEGRLVYMNRAGRKMLGMDDLVDLTRYNLSKFHDTANAHVVLTEGIPTAMREGVWSGETELMALDGRAIAVSQVILAHKAPDGTVAFLSTIARDITTQKRAEEALRVSERRHRRLFETAPDGILILDADTGQVIDANPFMKDLLGYSLEEFLGKKLWEVGPFKGVTASKTTFAELRQKDRVHYERLPLETKDGRRIEVEFISNVYLVNEKRLIQCNIRDITERLQLEAQYRQAQKMESVGQLASGIAHDFNNLLTIINGMSDLVLEHVGEDDPVHADVQEIHRAGERAATLTRQLLAFSRQQILEPRVMNFNAAVARGWRVCSGGCSARTSTWRSCRHLTWVTSRRTPGKSSK